MKVDTTVRRETLYIAGWVVFLSAIMEIVFLVAGFWDYTVILGNLLSGSVSVLNFFLMGLTVQRAVLEEKKKAANRMKLSQMLRMLMLFAAAAVGVFVPCFHFLAALIPLFFPRIGILFRPLIKRRKKQQEEKE